MTVRAHLSALENRPRLGDGRRRDEQPDRGGDPDQASGHVAGTPPRGNTARVDGALMA